MRYYRSFSCWQFHSDTQSFDLVMDQEAKTRWQRAKPPGQVIGLPGYLVAGEWVGVSLVSILSCNRKLKTA
jgi:hypothetical protein